MTAQRELTGLSFEEALQELEEIVKSLEGGQGQPCPGDRATTSAAPRCARHCERKLAEAEAKVQAIVEGPRRPDAARRGMRPA